MQLWKEILKYLLNSQKYDLNYTDTEKVTINFSFVCDYDFFSVETSSNFEFKLSCGGILFSKGVSSW